jgi:hypothetical protein
MFGVRGNRRPVDLARNLFCRKPFERVKTPCRGRDTRCLASGEPSKVSRKTKQNVFQKIFFFNRIIRPFVIFQIFRKAQRPKISIFKSVLFPLRSSSAAPLR